MRPTDEARLSTRAFRRWVRQFTVPKLAPRLGVSRQACYRYLNGGSPSLERARTIITLAEGQLSIRDLVRTKGRR